MQTLSKLLEPYIGEKTPEGFEALLLPALFLGYSVLLFFKEPYLLKLGILDKVFQSFLIGFFLTSLIHALVTSITSIISGKYEPAKQVRHPVQVSLFLAMSLTLAALFLQKP